MISALLKTVEENSKIPNFQQKEGNRRPHISYFVVKALEYGGGAGGQSASLDSRYSEGSSARVLEQKDR